MFEYLIQTSNPDAYFEVGGVGEGATVKRAGEVDGIPVLNILDAANPLKVGDVLVGGWDFEGVAVEPVDTGLFEKLRPLGNAPPRGGSRGGQATKHLVAHGFNGFGLKRQQSLRQLGPTQNDPYPTDNSPFAIEIRHKEWTGAWPGYGWRAEIVGGADSRDPSVRAIGVYSDPECTQYLYTTGAFVQGESDWQVDGDGEPLTVWYTEQPPGQRKPAPQDFHLAVLWASVQEGYQTLPVGSPGIQHLYWKETQLGGGGTARSNSDILWSGNAFRFVWPDGADSPTGIEFTVNGGQWVNMSLTGFLGSESVEFDFRHYVWEVLLDVGFTFEEPVPADEWVETGASVVTLLGTVVKVAPESEVAGLAPGTKVRFGNGAESTFDQFWPGIDGGMLVSPYPASVQIGDSLWVKTV